jgi:hypothetical protein
MNESPFCTIVKEAFNFLEKRHGSILVETGRATVIFKSSVCIVTLFHDDQRSFEVGLGLSQNTDSTQPSFTFDEILRSQEVPLTDWPSGYSVSALVDIKKLIPKMAKILSSYAPQLLEGEANAWSKINQQRQTDCVVYAAATNLNYAKHQANIAWSKQDYREVVSLLDRFRLSLEKADLAKLFFAKRTMANGFPLR